MDIIHPGVANVSKTELGEMMAKVSGKAPSVRVLGAHYTRRGCRMLPFPVIVYDVVPLRRLLIPVGSHTRFGGQAT